MINDKKIIVLDDDPTGTQTVHNISIFTDWGVQSIEDGFKEDSPLFYILTNSRALTEKETKNIHTEIATNISIVAKKLNKQFIIISRSDSTLRGHYPLETTVLKEVIENEMNCEFSGEILIPFFKAGGRITKDNIHYIQEGENITPVANTEFARDRTFRYTKSHLGEWIQEKTKGEFLENDTTYISIDDLQTKNTQKIYDKLLNVSNFNKVVVNATEYEHIQNFCEPLHMALKFKNFMFRSSASFVRVFGGINTKELLKKQDIITNDSKNGGLIIVGSHVKKTTLQFSELKKLSYLNFIELNCNLIFNPTQFKEEISKILVSCEDNIKKGITTVVYTSRQRIDIGENKEEEELSLSTQISQGITSIVKKLTERPKYIIGKGGITSSDIATKGLGIKKATVLGQVLPGIPVWLTANESKFNNMGYIVFPGNVGSETALKEVVEMLES